VGNEMIAVVDYGAGNVRSVINALELIKQKPVVTKDPDELSKASVIILPGVGAFGDCMQAIKRYNLVDPLNEIILKDKKPYLGICLGMQILAQKGLEKGDHEGLAWIQGTVKKMVPDEKKYRIPHMGWNDVTYNKKCPLFNDMVEAPAFYFVHSYHLEVDGPDADTVVASCWHGMQVTVALQKDNIFGVQFHPEKSQEEGIKLLKNFLKAVS
jgi:glutamine amidotransferase